MNDPRPDSAARLRGRWLVTGAAGFIGSHLVEELLRRGAEVVALDNLLTGSRANLDDALAALDPEAAARLTFIEGDIRDSDTCRRAADGAGVVLHQAALGSVPRSIDDPRTTNEINVDGFLNMLVAARDAGVARFVYASSSSVYGDTDAPTKREGEEGQPLSPYGASKRVNELYAAAFSRSYAMSAVGLRYFNVYGPRQDPAGAYAAVIPRWIAALLGGTPATIFGDGETSRDFTYVSDVVQANIDAAERGPGDGAFNVAYGARTSLNELWRAIRATAARHRPDAAAAEPDYEPPRVGDVRNSLADTARARAAFGYAPAVALREGLARTVSWYAERAGAAR